MQGKMGDCEVKFLIWDRETRVGGVFEKDGKGRDVAGSTRGGEFAGQRINHAGGSIYGEDRVDIGGEW